MLILSLNLWHYLHYISGGIVTISAWEIYIQVFRAIHIAPAILFCFAHLYVSSWLNRSGRLVQWMGPFAELLCISYLAFSPL